MTKPKPADTPRLKRGPKPAPAHLQRKNRTVRLNDARWNKLQAIHSANADWLDQQIDAYSLPLEGAKP